MKKYFFTGLLIWVPVVVTFSVIAWIINTLDKLIYLLPEQWRPQAWLGVDIPGLGMLFALLIIFITGLVTANVVGQRLVHLWEALLARIPVVKTIYNSVKQVSDTLFSSSGEAFRKAVLLQYPRQGVWTIAFITGKPDSSVSDQIGEGFISVYVPTTPNPTSGFFLVVPASEVRELDMSVDDALKYLISMGVAAPVLHPKKSQSALPAPALPSNQQPK